MTCHKKDCGFQQPWEHRIPCRREEGHPGVHEHYAAKARMMDVEATSSLKPQPKCFFVIDHTIKDLLTEEEAMRAVKECAKANPLRNFYICKIVNTTSIHKVVVVEPFEEK